MNTKEFVIWGIPPHTTQEELLATKANGEYITDYHTAKQIANTLQRLGCSNVRIQTIDLSVCPSKLFSNKNLVN